MYSPTDCTDLHRLFGCLQGGALVSARLCRLPEQEVHQLSKIDILPRNPQNPQNCLLSVFSHRLHRFTQKLGCLQGGALVSARLCRLPEQEVHQPSKIDILPRNPQNPQNCLLRMFSHRLHRFTQNCLLRVFSHRLHRFTQKLGCLQGGALVSARLCRLPEQEVHQPSKQWFSHRIHRTHRTSCRVYSPTDFTLSLQKNATQSHKR